jgi:hypothetical protein
MTSRAGNLLGCWFRVKWNADEQVERNLEGLLTACIIPVGCPPFTQSPTLGLRPS